MPTLTVLTLTGDREDGITLCAKYMDRQTLQPDRWIVVDDGVNPVDKAVVRGADVITRNRSAFDAAHTLPQNLLAALPLVRTDFLVFMEDDDWYHPEYLASMAQRLEQAPLAGECPALYYRVGTRMWRIMPVQPGRPHASMACTGVSQRMYPALAAACIGGTPHADLRLWSMMMAARQGLHEPAPRLCVGIKGMPGRRGQTSGWGRDEAGYTADPELAYLRSIIGADADAYAKYYEPRTGLTPVL